MQNTSIRVRSNVPAQRKARPGQTTVALFTRTKPNKVVEVEPPAPKRSLGGLFGGQKKKAVEVVEPLPAPKRSLGGLFGAQKKAVEVVEPLPAPKRSLGGLFGAQKKAAKADTGAKVDKAAEYKRKESVMSAFDFSAARSKRDAELLYDARYGKLEGGKMSREQYLALQRKVGGTARDYFKTWVDVKGDYTDKGYVSEEATNVPALPFLIITLLSLFGIVGYVISQTS